MTYSSFVDNPNINRGRSKYTELEIKMAGILNAPEVYLLNADDHPTVNGAKSIDMGDSLDIIVVGTIEEAEETARKTGRKVGIARYKGQEIYALHFEAVRARRALQDNK